MALVSTDGPIEVSISLATETIFRHIGPFDISALLFQRTPVSSITVCELFDLDLNYLPLVLILAFFLILTHFYGTVFREDRKADA